jgi:hypothetical protein
MYSLAPMLYQMLLFKCCKLLYSSMLFNNQENNIVHCINVQAEQWRPQTNVTSPENSMSLSAVRQ